MENAPKNLELIKTNDIEKANALALAKMFSKSKEVVVSQNFVPLQIVFPKKEMTVYQKTSQKVQQKYFYKSKEFSNCILPIETNFF